MLKIILSIILLSLSLSCNDLIKNFNEIVKNSENKELIEEYNKYYFEKPKEIIKFFMVNKKYLEFNQYYEKLSLKDKKLLLEYILDDIEDYLDFIKGIDLYSKIFIPTNIEDEQEIQYFIYNILIDNKNAYYNIIEHSDIKKHYLSIFNPTILVNLSKRYKYFVLMFATNNYLISYPNTIDFILSPDNIKLELTSYELNTIYEKSIRYYLSIDKVVEIPFSIRTIFLDRMNVNKRIEAYLNFTLETKLNDFILNLKDIKFYSKYSHELLLNFFKEMEKLKINSVLAKKSNEENNIDFTDIYSTNRIGLHNENEITLNEDNLDLSFKYNVNNQDLVKYFTNIGLNLELVKLNDNSSFLIRVKNRFEDTIYYNLEDYLNNNSIEFIY